MNGIENTAIDHCVYGQQNVIVKQRPNAHTKNNIVIYHNQINIYKNLLFDNFRTEVIRFIRLLLSVPMSLALLLPDYFCQNLMKPHLLNFVC